MKKSLRVFIPSRRVFSVARRNATNHKPQTDKTMTPIETNHTPGTWQACIADDQDFHFVDGGEHFANIAMIPHSSYSSTHGEPGKTIISKEECEANARLIAAAPELLEALQFVAKYAAMKPDTLPQQLTDAIQSAIAKATQP